MIWESEGLKYNGMFSSENNKKDPKKASKDKVVNQGEFLGAVFASAQLAYKRFLYLDLTAVTTGHPASLPVTAVSSILLPV